MKSLLPRIPQRKQTLRVQYAKGYHLSRGNTLPRPSAQDQALSPWQEAARQIEQLLRQDPDSLLMISKNALSGEILVTSSAPPASASITVLSCTRNKLRAPQVRNWIRNQSEERNLQAFININPVSA